MLVLPYYSALSSSWNDEKSIQTGNQYITFAMIFILVVIIIALTVMFIAFLLKKQYLFIQNDCDGGQLNDLRNSLIEPQSEIVPYYTQIPNPAIDIGVYDNNGNLILIQKPKPAYNHQSTSLNIPVNINQSFQSTSSSTSSSSDLPPSYTKY
jgi:hypothetical protein